jgi:hypothetical protein
MAERDREMAPERRTILTKVAPLLEVQPWEAVLYNVTNLVIDERAAAREEARREAIEECNHSWREWILYVERQFGGNMLFLEGFPPPDRKDVK